MPLRVGNVAGCCGARNFYNLGYMHGHPRAKDEFTFHTWLFNKEFSNLNFAISSYEQTNERRWLESAGWETKKVGTLFISTISSYDFNKFINSFGSKLREHRRIEAEKNRAEIEARREQQLERLQNGSKFSTNTIDVFRGKVTYNDVQRMWRNRGHNPETPLQDRERMNTICDYYKIPRDSVVFTYRYMHLDLLRDRIYRAVAKRRKELLDA